MSYTFYCAKTKRGWVTRWDLTGPLTDNGDACDAYCYDDLDKAVVVAKQFDADVIEVIVAGKTKVRHRMAEEGWVPYLD